MLYMGNGDFVMMGSGATAVAPVKTAIRIVAVGDFGEWLKGEEDLVVVAQSCEPGAVTNILRLCEPDIVLLDLEICGLPVLQTLAGVQRNGKIILLTHSEDTNLLVQAVRLGVSGIIGKRSAPELLGKSIRKVHAGEVWLDSNIVAAVMKQFATPQAAGVVKNGRGRRRPLLSDREREIVVLVAQGLKNREIGEKMFISQQTVKNHLHNVFEKLGVTGRRELVRYAQSPEFNPV